ncbi:MAG: aminotransferase class V-fold PLP-dependent enzyme [Oscillospiraceae bacterium]|nr:aminotransferase class V-fold PLP-dependent enzyme [Oscillospiraceae bacterium]
MRSVYLDNGATSFPKAPGVGEAMAKYIIESGVNINRGTYEKASGAAMAVLECREMLKELFHFKGRESQVIFTPGHTYGLNQIIRGFLKTGDHVIVSSMEHNAVMRPLVEMEQKGFYFDRIPADEAGRTNPEDIIPLIHHNTKLVVVNHASNVSGTIFPLQEISEICYKRGVPLAVDAAQTAGHMDIDMSKLHIAALSVPGHKGLLGPQGIGAMILDKDFVGALRPIVTGGTGSASNCEVQPSYLPDKYESGTLNLPGIIGLHKSVEFIMNTGVDKLQQHDKKCTQQFLEGVKDLPLRVVGPADVEQQVGVVSLDFLDKDNAEVAYRLEQDYGIMTRCGLHCAPNAHKTLGTFPHGTVRFSFGYSTTEEEIEYAVNAIKQMA